MRKLKELIDKLCPNGVEYKKLSEICNSLKKGTLKTVDLNDNGKYPVINSGRELYGFYNEYNNKNAITFAARGEYAGYISYFENEFWAGGLCYPYSSKNEKIITNKFLYYYLKTNENKIMKKLVARGSIPALNKSDLDRLLIPVPPLEVQCEIVRILDNFTLLSAELSAELKARQKQYEYYRNKLLTFEDAETLDTLHTHTHTHGYFYREEIKWIELKELFNTKNGYTPSKRNKEYWENGSIAWYRMEDIREKGRILSNSIQHVNEKSVKGSLFPKNSIIISTSATIGEYALITNDFLCNQRFTCLMIKDEYKDKYDIKFIFYYCYLLSDWCLNNLNQGNFAFVDMKVFEKFKFPIIDIERQKKIVNILDKFEKIINDITEGLPAEIEKRQKQYEYYRDKLLSFKELK